MKSSSLYLRQLNASLTGGPILYGKIIELGDLPAISLTGMVSAGCCQHTKNYGKSSCLMGKLAISTGQFLIAILT